MPRLTRSTTVRNIEKMIFSSGDFFLDDYVTVIEKVVSLSEKELKKEKKDKKGKSKEREEIEKGEEEVSRIKIYKDQLLRSIENREEHHFWFDLARKLCQFDHKGDKEKIASLSHRIHLCMLLAKQSKSYEFDAYVRESLGEISKSDLLSSLIEFHDKKVLSCAKKDETDPLAMAGHSIEEFFQEMRPNIQTDKAETEEEMKPLSEMSTSSSTFNSSLMSSEGIIRKPFSLKKVELNSISFPEASGRRILYVIDLERKLESRKVNVEGNIAKQEEEYECGTQKHAVLIGQESEVKEKLYSVTEEMKQLKLDISERKTLSESFSEEVESTVAHIAEQESLFKQYQGRIDELNKSSHNLSSELERLSIQIEQYESAKSQHHDLISRLEQKIKGYRSEIEKNKEITMVRQRELDEQIVADNNLMKREQKEEKLCETKLAQLRTSVIEMETQLISIWDEIDLCTTKQKGVNTQIEESREGHHILLSQIEDIQRRIGEDGEKYSSLESQRTELGERISQLTSELQSSQEKIALLNSQLSSMREDKRCLETQLEAAKHEREVFRDQAFQIRLPSREESADGESFTSSDGSVGTGDSAQESRFERTNTLPLPTTPASRGPDSPSLVQNRVLLFSNLHSESSSNVSHHSAFNQVLGSK